MILYDLFSTQGKVNGGAEYARAVFFELVKRDKAALCCVYDSSISLSDDIFDLCRLTDIELHDIHKMDIYELCSNPAITLFFIPIIQRYNWVDFTRVKCPITFVWHDVRELEIRSFRRQYWERRYRTLGGLVKTVLKVLLRPLDGDRDFVFQKQQYDGIIALCQKPNTTIITDSNHTKYSIRYFFPKIESDQIQVLYVPEKVAPIPDQKKIKNLILAGLIKEKKQFLLMISCDRFEKNVALFLAQSDRFFQDNPEFCAVLVGKIDPGYHSYFRIKERIFNIDCLSVNDLELAYQHAYCLVYPTLQEGFGLPPIEAMKYGTPVVAAGDTAIPELLGDAALLFCPFYDFELYARLMTLTENRQLYSELALQRYAKIKARQRSDFTCLLELIEQSDAKDQP